MKRARQPPPLKLRLDGNAQAGWVGGRDGGAFFDAQARVLQLIVTISDARFRVGADIWAGLQEDLRRLDIGLALTADIPVDQTRLDLRLTHRGYPK